MRRTTVCLITLILLLTIIPNLPSSAADDAIGVVGYDPATGLERIVGAGDIFLPPLIEGLAGATPILGPGGDGGITPYVVVGPDGRTRVTPTTSFPATATAKIYMKSQDGTISYICSGNLVSSWQVVTAAHCLYNRTTTQWNKDILVLPGMDDGWDLPANAPLWMSQFGAANWAQAWIPLSYQNTGAQGTDWGIIDLDRSVGNYAGYFGRAQLNVGDSRAARTIRIDGYPGDRDEGRNQYSANEANTGCTVTADEFTHRLDTAGGTSGSAIWYPSGTQSYIIGVHTHGTTASSCTNRGTPFVGSRYDDVGYFLTLGSSPTNKADLAEYVGMRGTRSNPEQTFSWSDQDAARANGPISGRLTIRNAGTAPASGLANFYLSSDPTITTTDYYLGQGNPGAVDPFSWKYATLSGYVPVGTPEGLYYFGWIIDPTNSVNEFDRSNNADFKRGSQVRIDNTAPTGVVNLPIGAKQSGFDLSYTAADTSTGVASVDLEVWMNGDSSYHTACTNQHGRTLNAAGSCHLSVSVWGVWQYRARVTDGAGNVGYSQPTYVVVLPL